MKKILAMLLVFVLAIGCFVGCGEDAKKVDNNPAATANKDSGSASTGEVKGEMTIEDISETVSKMNEGAAINLKVAIALKPSDSGDFSGDELVSGIGKELIKKNADGFYELPLVISGVASENGASLDLKLSDKKITDMIIVGENVYINAKAAFDYILTLAKAQGEELEVTWPFEAEYIDFVSLMGYLTELQQTEEPDYSIEYNDESFENIEFTSVSYDSSAIKANTEDVESAMSVSGMLFSLMDIDEETMKDIEALIEVLESVISEKAFKDAVSKGSEVLEKNNVISADDDSISIKLDSSNLKGLLLGYIDVLRTYGADCVDAFVQGVKKSDKISEQDKEMFVGGYDKEEVKKSIEEALNSEDFDKEIDEIVEAIGNTHFYIDMGADDKSVKFSMDFLIDGSKIETVSESGMDQVKFNMDFGCEVKEVSPVAAPSKVFTEADLSMLFLLLS